MFIRVLSPLDAEAYRNIRLRALLTDPEAFGSTYERESVRPLSVFADRLVESPTQFVLGCFEDSSNSPTGEETLVGIVTFMRETSPKEVHKANVYGMYVEEAYRGQGAGKLLLTTLIHRARTTEGVERLRLAVVSTNLSAKRLYTSLGFVVYGIEEKALKQGDTYFDEELMVLAL